MYLHEGGWGWEWGRGSDERCNGAGKVTRGKTSRNAQIIRQIFSWILQCKGNCFLVEQ